MYDVTRERLAKYIEALENRNTSELDTFDSAELRSIENTFQHGMRALVENDRENPDHIIMSAYDELYPDEEHPHSKSLEDVIFAHRYDAECVVDYIESDTDLEIRFISEMRDEEAPNFSDPDDTEAFGRWITDKCDDVREKLNDRKAIE